MRDDPEGGTMDGERGEEPMDERTSDGERPLPVTPGQAYDPAAPESDAGPALESDAGPHPEVEEVPSWRLITTLAVAGALAGLLIVGVFEWAQPQILAHRAEVMRTAIQEVLGAPDRVQTLYVVDGELSEQPPAGVDTTTAERVFLGYGAGGEPVGYAVTGEKAGFQDIISLIFGYDPAADEVLGMRVLESKETPGLGDKIYKDSSFVAEFVRVGAPIQGVKDGGDAPDEVDMITGATISSETVIEIINTRVRQLEPMLEGYMARGGGSP
ncbi:MAG: FMN-binding protein [Longimicrobiales bacterium]|nr:FMN-binding protein [Longimicrobiales bacterium]